MDHFWNSYGLDQSMVNAMSHMAEGSSGYNGMQKAAMRGAIAELGYNGSWADQPGYTHGGHAGALYYIGNHMRANGGHSRYSGTSLQRKGMNMVNESNQDLFVAGFERQNPGMSLDYNGDGSVKATTKAGKKFYKDAGLGYVGTTGSGKWDKRGTSYKDVFE